MPFSSINIFIFSDEERFYHFMDGIDCSCSLCVGKWNIFISGCDDFASPRDHVTRGNITVTKACHGTKIIITAPGFISAMRRGSTHVISPFIILLKYCLYEGGYNHNCPESPHKAESVNNDPPLPSFSPLMAGAGGQSSNLSAIKNKFENNVAPSSCPGTNYRVWGLAAAPWSQVWTRYVNNPNITGVKYLGDT